MMKTVYKIAFFFVTLNFGTYAFSTEEYFLNGPSGMKIPMEVEGPTDKHIAPDYVVEVVTLKNVDTVLELCRDGYDLRTIEEPDVGSLLHIAVHNRDIGMLEVLVNDCKLDVDNLVGGKSPIQVASELRYQYVVQALMRLGADPLAHAWPILEKRRHPRIQTIYMDAQFYRLFIDDGHPLGPYQPPAPASPDA